MKYDAVIIGGGLAGLTTAAMLAKRGKKVIILEQHLTVGGLAAGFTRKGFYFDSGMSRVNQYTLMSPLKEFGILKESDFKPHRSAINLKGHLFDYTSLKTLFEETSSVFVTEKNEILALYHEQIEPVEKMFMTAMSNDKRHGFGKLAHLFHVLKVLPGMMHGMSSDTNVNDLLRQYLDENGEVFSFLSVREDEINYRGRMSLTMFVGKWYTQLMNVYPAGGFQSIADRLASYIKSLDGEISTSSRVCKILVESKKCTGVEVVRGGKTEIVLADNIISGIDLRKTFFNLIGEEYFDPEIISRLRNSRVTVPIPILYLGLNIPPEKIRAYFHGNEELYYYPQIKCRPSNTLDRDFYVNSHMVMHSSSLLNEGHAPANQSNVQIYLQAPPHGWLNNWGIVDGTKTAEYRNIKQMVIRQLLDSLENVIPDIKDRNLIEVCELGTPHTIERFTGNTDGSGCGFTWDEDLINNKRFGKFFESYHGLKNLYFVGHQTGYPGAAGTAMMSGWHIGKKIKDVKF